MEEVKFAVPVWQASSGCWECPACKASWRTYNTRCYCIAAVTRIVIKAA